MYRQHVTDMKTCQLKEYKKSFWPTSAVDQNDRDKRTLNKE